MVSRRITAPNGIWTPAADLLAVQVYHQDRLKGSCSRRLTSWTRRVPKCFSFIHSWPDTRYVEPIPIEKSWEFRCKVCLQPRVSDRGGANIRSEGMAENVGVVSLDGECAHTLSVVARMQPASIPTASRHDLDQNDFIPDKQQYVPSFPLRRQMIELGSAPSSLPWGHWMDAVR